MWAFVLATYIGYMVGKPKGDRILITQMDERTIEVYNIATKQYYYEDIVTRQRRKKYKIK
ncbi:MAG: hypothetical protein ACPG5B_06745 [Chitinophagales bacterium]